MAEVATAIATAMLAGVLHVILGPDHLSAIVTVSVCQQKKAFFNGIRWGIGHSFGLCLVGMAIWILSGSYRGVVSAEKSWFSQIPNYFVGVFMVGFGVYFLIKSRSITNNYEEVPVNSHRSSIAVNYELDGLDSSSEDPSPIGKMTRRGNSRGDSPIELDALESVENPIILAEEPPLPATTINSVNTSSTSSTCVQRLASFAVGVVHGVGGPGGLLGLLPTSRFRTLLGSSVYLMVFLVSSTIMMGLVAAAWGEFTARIASSSGGNSRMVAALYIFSSGMSILVGCLWIILVATGKLDEMLGEP
eukprot:Platyproteum_vivax@DN5244_c0_g1_i1.p1